MENPPDSRDGPSTAACLVQHAKLAQIANMVQVELLAHQIAGHERAVTLDRSIAQWYRNLHGYFDENTMLETWFEIPSGFSYGGPSTCISYSIDPSCFASLETGELWKYRLSLFQRVLMWLNCVSSLFAPTSRGPSTYGVLAGMPPTA
jgi:hypothetical protein